MTDSKPLTVQEFYADYETYPEGEAEWLEFAEGYARPWRERAEKAERELAELLQVPLREVLPHLGRLTPNHIEQAVRRKLEKIPK